MPVEKDVESYRRFLQGDESALTEIIQEYKDGLILYLNGIVRNIDTAEDLTEETFVKLVVKRPRFSGASSFKTWLYAIGRNLAMDYLRRNKTAVSLDDCSWISDEVCDLERSWIEREEKIRLHRMMETLKPAYYQVLYLRYFEDFSCSQIARILKKTTHSTETLLYRAKLALKQRIKKEGLYYEDL